VSTSERHETEELRARLETLEREHAEQMARMHEALTAAQERSYWLDRWNLDLNALMRRRGAAEFRAAIRALRFVIRGVRKVGRRLRGTDEP
jgi:hypothetical protein